MSIHRQRAHIPAGAVAAYELVAEPSRWPAWLSTVHSVSPDAPSRPGTEYRLKGEFGAGLTEQRAIVTHLNPPYDAFFHFQGAFDATVSFHLAEVGDEAEVELTVNTHPESSRERAAERRLHDEMGSRLAAVVNDLAAYFRARAS